jgi:hypothetical protein
VTQLAKDFAATCALAGIVLALSCAALREPTDADLAAGSQYAADHIACVDAAKTLEESKACRARVRERWGVVEVRRDGGR